VAPQQTFPSQNGTLPMVSPDGQWVAYQETGWGRPGGTGGTGRSNLLSLVHAVRSDGTGDRILSDMFLRGWLADSRRVASARDNCAAIANLAGRVVAEFGEPYVDRSRLPPGTPADWRDRDMRSQMGFGSMPHSRALFPLRLGQDEHGEGAAFSPDGAWFGPLDAVGSGLFLGADGARRQMQQGGGGLHQMGHFAIWAPAADRVALVSGMSLSVLDFRDMTVRAVTAIDPLTVDGHAGAPTWTPWDREGRHLTFVRGGQVWVSDVDGNEAHQLTFDSTSKRFPVFSPDGSRIAYIVWQPDKRQYWEAPTDVWVVDVRTALAVRVTEPDAGRIGGLDWLDGEHLIYDRLVRPAPLVFSSTLRTADLARRADQ
jgi:hypothetical protein